MREAWIPLGALLVLTSALAGGCGDDGQTGDDGGTAGSGGTGQSVGGSGGTGTGTGGSGAAGGAGGSGGSATCTYNGFEVVEDHVRDATPVASIYIAEGDAAAPMDLFVVQSWHDIGAPVGAYEHSFSNPNYKDCQTCALIGQACPNPTGMGQQIEYDLPSCEKIFLVMSGQLSINGGGSAYAGTLTDAVAVEVDIDWQGDFTSTPAGDGETWCISSISFPM